jgi:nucleoid DNA-binding protein
MSSTELIQEILKQFKNLSRSEQVELVDILMRHIAHEVKQEQVEN